MLVELLRPEGIQWPRGNFFFCGRHHASESVGGSNENPIFCKCWKTKNPKENTNNTDWSCINFMIRYLDWKCRCDFSHKPFEMVDIGTILWTGFAKGNILSFCVECDRIFSEKVGQNDQKSEWVGGYDGREAAEKRKIRSGSVGTANFGFGGMVSAAKKKISSWRHSPKEGE